MRVFISADIEGTAGITCWPETNADSPEYKKIQQQMTREVAAACRGALKLGAEVVVRDAHDSARNLIFDELPEGVKLIRNWNGHPYKMMFGIDETFDAAIMTGYHSAAGLGNNPLSHTMSSSRIFEVFLNGERLSEFRLNAITAAAVGARVAFVSGDVGLAKDVKAYDSRIRFYGTNEGFGESILANHPATAVKNIEKGVEDALKNLDRKPMPLPDHFELKAVYKSHTTAYRHSFYPGVEKVNDTTLIYRTDDVIAFLTAFGYII